MSPNAASQLDFFAGLITEMKGHSVPMGPGAINFSVREPLGVVAKILPTEPETKMGAIGAVGDRTRKVSGGTDQLYAGEEYLYPAAAAEQRGQAGLLEKDFMNIDAQWFAQISTPPLRLLVLLLAVFFLASVGKADDRSANVPTPDRPLKVKVVVLTTFEIGADTGDTPGEFQYWVERRKMETVIPLANAYHDVRTDGTGVIATVTGMATANAASSVMALGTDPRFDLSKAYWIVAGIAGINPSRGSLGSAVWADCVVDGDVAYEIDGREIPGSWSTGVIPWERTKPYEEPRPTDMQQLYRLNPALVDWAVRDTKDVVLDDTPGMKKMRDAYTGFSKAQEPPKVTKGATLSTSRFWEGVMMSKWAEDWVRYWSGGASQYYTTTCEDSGIMRALTNLANAKKIDLNRVLVLRTASDFDQPPAGETPAQSLATKDSPEHFGGFLPSLEAAFRVGNKVVSDIVSHWEKYSLEPPK